MKISEHYIELGKKTNEILDESLKSEDIEILASNHLFLDDFAKWLDVLKERPEYDILKNAIKEYQISILSNSLGLYQQAFMGLRFFFERTLVALLFSANEIELNLWKIGERDTYWNEIIDESKGVFLLKFCRAFFPELNDEINHFLAITKKVYRECSEYAHGNHSAICKIPDTLVYSEELFNEWNIKAGIIRRIILFTFCLRYLKSFNFDKIRIVENSINEELKSISQITEILNKPL